MQKLIKVEEVVEQILRKDEYARNNEYLNLTIKTGNNKREMLSYLVKNNWNFVEVIPEEKLEDNEIILKKEL